MFRLVAVDDRWGNPIYYTEKKSWWGWQPVKWSYFRDKKTAEGFFDRLQKPVKYILRTSC